MDITPAVWAIVCIGLQGEFFDGREPNREASADELKMLQYNAQAYDIIFNGLCPEEFNKISRLENAKEIWDTLIDMHEGTDSVKESKLDALLSAAHRLFACLLELCEDCLTSAKIAKICQRIKLGKG